MTSLRVFACVATLASIPFAPLAQDKPQLFVLEPGEYDVLALIQRSGQFLERTYIVDKTQDPELCNVGTPRYRIQIDRRLELDRQSCEEVVGKMLLTRGLVATPIDVERGIYDWISLNGPRQPELRKGVRTLPASDISARPRVVDYVMTTVRLDHAHAQLASASMRQFFTDPRGFDQILAVGERSLMITGLRPSVASILGVVKEIDVPDPAAPSLEQKLADHETRLQRIEAALKEKR